MTHRRSLWASLSLTLLIGPICAGDDAITFTPIPGVQEFSGRLIARPVQPQAWLAQGLSPEEAARRVQAARAAIAPLQVREYVPQTDEYVFYLPHGWNENSKAAALLATGNFQYIHPDWILFPAACPNDPRLPNQWHHARVQSCDAWGVHTGSPTVTVAICDTGIRATHEDLLLNRKEGYNAVDRLWQSQGGQITDLNGHGTNVVGAAAANGNNARGVAGMGWSLGHRMMRVSNSSNGNASLSDLTHAARTAVDAGDRVASVSYGGATNSSVRTTATYIKSRGGLLVWAAGNANENLTTNDRDADNVIVVGATDQNDNKATFSSYGRYVDLMAPGVGIHTTASGSNTSYATVSGTSFAAPLVAGLAALIWSADPALTPDQVEQIIKQSCDDLGTAGVNNTFGYGRINAKKALELAVPTAPCYADCDSNGKLDFFDFLCFQNAFVAADPWADCNGDGKLDFFDFLCFQNEFLAGCP
jgi:subtilisin family serine protease